MLSPCKHGHFDGRYVGGNCITCSKTSAAKHQIENPEVVAATKKRYYARNLRAVKARSTAQYLKDPTKAKEDRRRNLGMPEPTRPRPEHCECCGRHQSEFKRLFALDHCHTTGRFRGWLCGNCNPGIGQLGDTIAGLQRALAYLHRVNN